MTTASLTAVGATGAENRLNLIVFGSRWNGIVADADE